MASDSNSAAIRLGGGGFGSSMLNDAKQVALFHDQQVFTVDLHLGAGPLAEQHAVARHYVELDDGALLVARPRSDRQHLPLARLLLDGVGDDNAARGFLVRRDPA